jgi:hypothetical protein
LNDSSAGMRHFELPAGEETLDFTGRLLAAVDNDRGDRPRWAELRLYKILDSTEGKEIWLIYTIGHTLVYHCGNSPCNRGIPVPVEEFAARAEDPGNAEPCEVCKPADWQDASPGTLFELEVTWYSYTPCSSAEKVLDALRREPRCKNCRHKPHETYRCWCDCRDYAEAPRPLSVPGARLVESVKAIDPDIARAAGRKVRF